MCFKKGLLNSPVCYAMIEQIEPQIRTQSFAVRKLRCGVCSNARGPGPRVPQPERAAARAFVSFAMIMLINVLGL